jgi:hypothetical protein
MECLEETCDQQSLELSKVVAVQRSSVIGVAIVAILALSFTAAAVETGLETYDGGFSGDGSAQMSPDQSASAGSDGSGDTDSQQERVGTPPSEADSDSQAKTGPSLWQVMLSITLLTVGGVVIVYGLTSGDDTAIEPAITDEENTQTSPSAERSTFGADVAPTNDVYRVWRQFHETVCGSAVAVSPADVAMMAVADGFDSDAVETLVTEFRAVRYGAKSPTDEREQRARDAGTTLGIWSDTAETACETTEASE